MWSELPKESIAMGERYTWRYKYIYALRRGARHPRGPKHLFVTHANQYTAVGFVHRPWLIWHQSLDSSIQDDYQRPVNQMEGTGHPPSSSHFGGDNAMRRLWVRLSHPCETAVIWEHFEERSEQLANSEIEAPPIMLGDFGTRNGEH